MVEVKWAQVHVVLHKATTKGNSRTSALFVREAGLRTFLSGNQQF